jgi:hypothetical protein
MIRLYVSTDFMEAIEISGKILKNKYSRFKKDYQAEDISSFDGELLRPRLRFNPMSAFTFERLNEKDLAALITFFSKQDLYVAVEKDGRITENNSPKLPSHFVVDDNYRILREIKPQGER